MKNMVNSDTVKLLQECDAGTKMAVSTIDEVLDNVRDTDMKRLLQESKNHHEKLGNEIHSLLISHGTEEKDSKGHVMDEDKYEDEHGQQ